MKKEEIEVGMPSLSFVSLAGTLLFLFCAIMSAIHEGILVSAMFIPFILSTAFLFLFCGKVRLNKMGIGYRNKLGDYFILWDEIQAAESGCGNFVLGNNEKRITLPIPGYWGGKGKAEAISILAKFFDSRSLKMKETCRAIFLFPKNTKIETESGSEGD